MLAAAEPMDLAQNVFVDGVWGTLRRGLGALRKVHSLFILQGLVRVPLLPDKFDAGELCSASTRAACGPAPCTAGVLV
jgi:hypothetical protein